MTQPVSYADLLAGHLHSYLEGAAKQVERGAPFGEIAAAARASPAGAAARTVGIWVAEDLLSSSAVTGVAEVGALRERASRAERAVSEASARLSQVAEPSAPAAAEALQELAAVVSGEVDALQATAARGFLQAAGSPLVEGRPGLSLSDMRAEGNRMAFDRPRGPPPSLALEAVANLRQDVGRLKHYGLNDVLSRTFRPMAVAVSSSYFKAVRPPVQLEGDLFEFKAISGMANAADVWAEAVQDSMLEGFSERLRARNAGATAGPEAARGDIVRALELERAALDLAGALQAQPEAAAIPAEALVLLVVPAKLTAGGLTP